jgi:hypothetical protein
MIIRWDQSHSWYCCVSSLNFSADAVRLVTNKLTSLSMGQFEGESIVMVNKAINCTYKWLNMLGRLPPDFEVIVMRIYKTTSIPSFGRKLEAIKSLHYDYLTCKYVINHATLMEMCLQFYEESFLEGTWDRSGDGLHPDRLFHQLREKVNPKTSIISPTNTVVFAVAGSQGPRCMTPSIMWYVNGEIQTWKQRILLLLPRNSLHMQHLLPLPLYLLLLHPVQVSHAMTFSVE